VLFSFSLSVPSRPARPNAVRVEKAVKKPAESIIAPSIAGLTAATVSLIVLTLPATSARFEEGNRLIMKANITGMAVCKPKPSKARANTSHNLSEIRTVRMVPVINDAEDINMTFLRPRVSDR